MHHGRFHRRTRAAAIALLLPLLGCGPKPEPAAQSATPRLKPVASVQDLMQALVDPAADEVWASVSSEVSPAGTVDRQPQTDEEWKAIRLRAIQLAEAANLLLLEDRRVAHEGRPLEDAHVEGILSADAIRQKIDADPPRFAERARVLQAAAEATLAAIDARNVEQLLEAGYRLDQACESCHRVYWYPGDKRPPGS
jgi:hypothetical protein